MTATKSALRDLMKERRRKLAVRQSEFAARFADVLLSEIEPEAGAAVGAYWPLAVEADPRILMERLHARGALVALPCMLPDRGLVFRRWRPDDMLRQVQFGIFEPPPEAPEIAPTLIFVPLLAFDNTGARLGHGAGYYDRALRQARARGSVLAIGCAYAAQEVEKIPTEPQDEPLDAVVTETGFRWFVERPGGFA